MIVIVKVSEVPSHATVASVALMKTGSTVTVAIIGSSESLSVINEGIGPVPTSGVKPISVLIVHSKLVAPSV